MPSILGAIRGETYSLPLQVELLHQDYNTVGAFTAAALLAIMAIITLMVKSALQWRLRNVSNNAKQGQNMSTEINHVHKNILIALKCCMT